MGKSQERNDRNQQMKQSEQAPKLQKQRPHPQLIQQEQSAIIPKQTRQSSPTFCSCSPRSFSITLDLTKNCNVDTLKPNDGIAFTMCDVEVFDARGTLLNNGNDTPQIITSITFIEMNSMGTVIHVDDQYTNVEFSTGSTFQLTSISAQLQPEIPIGKQSNYVPSTAILFVIGRNSRDEEVIAEFVWIYSNSCHHGATVTEGDVYSWNRIGSVEDQRGEFCPAHVSNGPSLAPTISALPSASRVPSGMPSGVPSSMPSGVPSGNPSMMPSGAPSWTPSLMPSGVPTGMPSGEPSGVPSGMSSGVPTVMPSGRPSQQPSEEESLGPSSRPSSNNLSLSKSSASKPPSTKSLLEGSSSSSPSLAKSSKSELPSSSSHTSDESFLPTHEPTKAPLTISAIQNGSNVGTTTTTTTSSLLFTAIIACYLYYAM